MPAPLLYTSQKLSGEWSAANFANNLDAEMADKLMGEWAKLDTGVRMRLLLSTLFMTQEQRDSIRQQMQRLIDYAIDSGEEDDWVKVIAHAVRQLDGQLDLTAVASSSKDVEAGIAALTSQMQSLHPVGYQPLETPYLHPRLVSPATVQLATQQRQQLPFTVRPGAEQVLHAVSITPAREDKPSAVAGGHGARNTPGQGVSGEGMFRSASKPLGSRRSSALGHAGSLPAQERRAKVMAMPTELALEKLSAKRKEPPAEHEQGGGDDPEPTNPPQ